MNFRQDGPHGVGGWLALLVAGMLVIGPLLGIGRTYGEFASAEHQYPVLAQVAEWSSFKTAEWIALLVFCAISIYGGLGLATNRTPDAVSRAKLVLWFNYPISIVVIGMIIPAALIPDSGKDVALAIPSLIASLIAVGIWTAYLNRSKRVKNTYGITNMTLAPEKVNAGSPISEGSSHIAPQSQSTTQQQTAVDEERIYTVIANELETGAVDKGLWTRLFSECGGDETQTKVLYIKQRAARLISVERAAESNELKKTREDAKVCVAKLKTRGYSTEQHRDGFWIVYAPDGSCTHIEDVAHLLQYAQQVS